LLKEFKEIFAWTYNGITVSSTQRPSWSFGHSSFTNLLLLNNNIKNYNVFPVIDQKNSKIIHHKTSLKSRNLAFSFIGNLLIYCHACTPSFTSTTHNKIFTRSTLSAITTMKKEKQTPLLANNKSQQKHKTQQMQNGGTHHTS
jgi:hypothetical protein